MDHEAPAPPPHEVSMTCVCGYNLTGTAVGGSCPECGVAVAESIRRHAGPTRPPTSGLAITSLVLGVVSLLLGLCLGPFAIIGVAAVIFGILAVREAQSGRRGGATMGLAIAGIVMGALATMLVVLMMAFFGIALARGGP